MAKMHKFKKSGISSKTKKTAILKNALKVSYVTMAKKNHINMEYGSDQKQKSTYTFSSIFPNADIMNRAHRVISQVEYVK